MSLEESLVRRATLISPFYSVSAGGVRCGLSEINRQLPMTADSFPPLVPPNQSISGRPNPSPRLLGATASARATEKPHSRYYATMFRQIIRNVTPVKQIVIKS